MNFLNGLILCNTQSSATFFVNRLLPDILTESFSFAQKKREVCNDITEFRALREIYTKLVKVRVAELVKTKFRHEWRGHKWESHE